MTDKAISYPDVSIPDDVMRVADEIAACSLKRHTIGCDVLAGNIARAIMADRSRRDPGLTAEVERLREALRRAKPFLASRELVDESKFGKGCSAATPVLQAARAALGEA